MHAFPHHYRVCSSGSAEGGVETTGEQLPVIDTTAPPMFDGPPGHWSPETLLVASVSSCFVLSFRGVARASKLSWRHLECPVEGVLDRVEGKNRFTRFVLRPTLTLASDSDADKARRCMDKAEQICLITNSLSAEIDFEPTVQLG